MFIVQCLSGLRAPEGQSGGSISRAILMPTVTLFNRAEQASLGYKRVDCEN
jgi:hypothetical protein